MWLKLLQKVQSFIVEENFEVLTSPEEKPTLRKQTTSVSPYNMHVIVRLWKLGFSLDIVLETLKPNQDFEREQKS